MKISNPSNNQLKEFSEKSVFAHKSQWGSYNFITKVKSRSPKSTFVVANNHSYSIPTISRELFNNFSKYQDDFLKKHDQILINGEIGASEKIKASVELLIDKSHPHIAAMQKQLLFPANQVQSPDFKVIYTPSLPAPKDFQNKCAILVNLEENITRIAGTDYFGESKKAGLRMWNKWIYDQGGLALHAGCKIYKDTNGQKRSMLIIGLSGTGKTTTTFTPHSGSIPVQDDFCALFPGGQIFASENGCFAKTYGLNKYNEPLVYQGVTNSNAWLENVFIDNKGIVDFNNDLYTTNGRGTFELSFIDHGNLINIPPLAKILILNRNFNIMPAMVKLNHDQAAAFFMLGETTGTSAGGVSEAGKPLRIPGTNPFFPLDHTLQGNRFLSLLSNSPDIEVILMNTGYIGQFDSKESAEKITIEHSRKLIDALIKDELQWKQDPDFFYQQVKETSSPVEQIFISPRAYYCGKGRESEYIQIRNKIIKERLDYLASYRDLDNCLIRSLIK